MEGKENGKGNQVKVTRKGERGGEEVQIKKCVRFKESGRGRKQVTLRETSQIRD